MAREYSKFTNHPINYNCFYLFFLLLVFFFFFFEGGAKSCHVITLRQQRDHKNCDWPALASCVFFNKFQVLVEIINNATNATTLVSTINPLIIVACSMYWCVLTFTFSDFPQNCLICFSFNYQIPTCLRRLDDPDRWSVILFSIMAIYPSLAGFLHGRLLVTFDRTDLLINKAVYKGKGSCFTLTCSTKPKSLFLFLHIHI